MTGDDKVFFILQGVGIHTQCAVCTMSWVIVMIGVMLGVGVCTEF